MRIKTINSIVKEIKMVDVHSAVNQGMLRVLIATNRLDFFHRGNRIVIDADKLPDDINLLFGIDGNKAIPRIRSIHNAFLELRKISPELGVSEERIRTLVGLNKLPHIVVGNRAYVALECFEAPYNERLIYDDYRDDEEEMLKRKAQEQFEANMARKKTKK